jgi:hypothetical protein
MDCGIESGNYGVLADSSFRFEIYKNWKSIISREPNYSAQTFCRDKEIPFEALGNIVREFDSYDPTGERWGYNK